MPELNVDIPVFEAYVRNEFLYNFKKGHGEFTKAAVFGVASVPGRALGFHVLLANGACYGRLPILALASSENITTTNVKHISDLQLWDCPSEHVSCIVYDLLKESRCHVLLPSGEQQGQYMFTLDWWGSTYAENAGALGWKSACMIRLDNGYFVLQPNNRILWENPAFIKKVEKPDYALTERIWKCEGGGTTGDNYFYNTSTEPWIDEEEEEEKPVPYVPASLASAVAVLDPAGPYTSYELGSGGPVLPISYLGKNCIYCEEYPCVCSQNEEVWN